MDFGNAFNEYLGTLPPEKRKKLSKLSERMEEPQEQKRMEEPQEQKPSPKKEVELYGHTISQSNMLTESRRLLDVVEQRCVYLIIDTIRNKRMRCAVYPKDLFSDNWTIEMTTQYLTKATDVKKTARAFNSLKKLRDKGFEVQTEDGPLYIGIINWARWSIRKKCYEIQIPKEIIPYIVELTNKFTTYELCVAMTLKSKYSQRFYEFCNQYKNKEDKRFFYDIDKLRSMLNLENEYKLYSGFRENVLNKAQKEIKALFDEGRCDLWFDYYEDEATKKGKAYTRIWFNIHTKTDEEEREKELNDRFYRRLWIIKFLNATFKRDIKYNKRIVNAIDKNPELVEPIYDRLFRMVENEEKTSHAPLTRYILKNDFGLK